MPPDKVPKDHLKVQSPEKISRRRFLSQVAATGIMVGATGVALSSPLWLKDLLGKAAAKTLDTRLAHDLYQSAPLARYWVSTESSQKGSCLVCHTKKEIAGQLSYDHKEQVVKCLLCAKECLIKPGERGHCRSRVNVAGQLRSLVYGRPVSMHVDPVEKKPLYHFLPGSSAFSLATTGCPLQCKFCQNWEISQARPEDFTTRLTPPEAIVSATQRRRSQIIAFTYNEPTVFTEYLTDVARLARKEAVRSVLISCGYMNSAPLAEMCSVLEAIKIDLKGFSKDFYRRACGGELAPVLRSIKQVAKSGIHLEIVNLVVPTLNDSEQMLTDLAEWVVGEVGPDVPVHFTRFHPDYQMRNLPPTPVATLERAYDIAKDKGIHYPFVGNFPGHPGNNTYCPKCGKVVIGRTGFFTTSIHLKAGRCEFCDEPIAGVWA